MKAAEFHSSLAQGKNLAQARRSELAELTLAEMFAEYIERHAKKSRKTVVEIEKQFERDFFKMEKS